MSARCCRADPGSDLTDGGRPHGRSRRGWRLAGRSTAAAIAATLSAVPLAATGVPAGAAATPPPATPATVRWTVVHPAHLPPPLSGAAAAYDGDTSTVVLFGGSTGGGTLQADTWTWNGTTWTDLPASQTHAPPARRGASMAFDPTLHRLLLFGGTAADGSLLGDTWAWNGASWAELSSGSGGGPAPAPRQGAAMALDRTGALVLFGGTGYSTPPAAPAPTTRSPTAPPATQSPTGQSATAQSPSNGVPAGQSPADPATTTQTGSATPDQLAARRVLGDTWQWTLSGWVQAATSGPAPVTAAAAAFDSSSGTTLLFGGSTTPPGVAARPSAQTWTWNGRAWTRSSSTTAPPARLGAELADSPATGGVLLLDGTTGSGALADAWTWTPAGWARASVAATAAPRSAAAWASDVPSGSGGTTTLVFGGTDGSGATLGDTEVVTASVPVHTTPTTAPEPAPGRPVGSSSPTSSAGATPAPSAAPSSPATTGHTTTPPTTTGPPGPAPAGATHNPPTGVALGPAPATATASVPTIATSTRSAPGGARVHVGGDGFRPGTIVTISLHSAPELLGRAVVDPSGRFSTWVSVPAGAVPGEHHIVATGTSSSGQPAQLTDALTVLAHTAHGPSAVTVAFLSGLALLVPVATWLAMAGAGWWRRRSAHHR